MKQSERKFTHIHLHTEQKGANKGSQGLETINQPPALPMPYPFHDMPTQEAKGPAPS
jgi:hypothetical protein